MLAAATGRASHWQPCGAQGEAALFLKAPAARGKQQWVLKRDFADRKRKPEYVVAESLRGICRCLARDGVLTDAAAVERWLSDCAPLEHEALSLAATRWRELSAAAQH